MLYKFKVADACRAGPYTRTCRRVAEVVNHYKVIGTGKIYTALYCEPCAIDAAETYANTFAWDRYLPIILPEMIERDPELLQALELLIMMIRRYPLALEEAAIGR